MIRARADLEAAGKPYSKPKYHVCVCLSERLYFLVNKKAKFADSFPIRREDLPILEREVSYIACGDPLAIPDEVFRRRQHEVVGRLPDNILVKLIDHVADAEALTERQKELIIDALSEAVGFELATLPYSDVSASSLPSRSLSRVLMRGLQSPHAVAGLKRFRVTTRSAIGPSPRFPARRPGWLRPAAGGRRW